MFKCWGFVKLTPCNPSPFCFQSSQVWFIDSLAFIVSESQTLKRMLVMSLPVAELWKSFVNKTSQNQFCSCKLENDFVTFSSNWPDNLVHKLILATIASSFCHKEVPALHWIDFCQTYLNHKTLSAHLNIRSHCFIGEHPQGQEPISRASPKICFWRTMLFEHLRCLFFRLEW